MTLFLWDLLLFQKYHDCPFLNVSHSFFCRSSETRPPEDDEEEEEEILGSDDDEQEDPKDYVKGKTAKKRSAFIPTIGVATWVIFHTVVRKQTFVLKEQKICLEEF